MKKAGSLLLIFSLILQIVIFSVPAVSAEPQSDSPFENQFGIDLIAKQGSLSLYAEYRSGRIFIEDSATGVIYSSNPMIAEDDESVTPGQKKLLASQLDILYCDSKNKEHEKSSYIGCISKGSFSHRKRNNGLDFTYIFKDEGIRITVSYTLKDGKLCVDVPVKEIDEGFSTKLIEISVLPYFNCGTFTDEGFILLPDGCGSIIEMNNGRQAGKIIKERVYGDDTTVSAERQDTVKENMTFPIIGINRGENSTLAVITEGDACAYVNAYTANMKKIFNCAYFSFEYRQTGTHILDSSSSKAKTVKMISEKVASCKNFSVEYNLLTGKSTYSDMAQCYKEYFSKDKEFKFEENLPFYVDCYGAVRKKGTFFYIPVTVTEALTTYKQAGNIMKSLDKNGIENIVFSYDGWTKGGVSGKMPVKGKFENKLGGKKDFKELVKLSEKLDVKFMPNVNLVDLNMSGYGYSKNSAGAASLDRSPGLQYSYNLFSRLRNKKLKPYYLIEPNKFEKIVKQFYKSYKLDTFGISLKKNGNELYSDYHKESCDRLQHIKYLNRVFNYVSKNNQEILTKSANAYAAVNSDFIMEAPVNDSGYDITDYSVPFYQLVLSGITNYSVNSVNLSSDVQKTFLKAIETGSGLCYSFAAQNFSKTENTYLAYLYNSNYKDWLDTAAKQYKELNKIYKSTEKTPLVSHETVDEGIYKVQYANGLTVLINYTDKDFTCGDSTVSAMNYLILER